MASQARVPTKFERVAFAVWIGAFIGAGVPEILRRMLGWSEAEFMASVAGNVSLVSQGFFMLAMLVLFPVAGFLRRKDRDGPLSPWSGWALLFFPAVFLVALIAIFIVSH